MSIVYLTEAVEFGASEVQLSATMSRAAASGHDVSLLCPRSQGLQRWLSVLDRRGLGRVIRCVPRRRWSLVGWSRTAYELFAHADLVHFHLDSPMAAEVPLSLTCRTRTPFLVTFASVPPGLKELPSRTLATYAEHLRRAARIFTSSRAASRRLVNQFGLHPDFLQVNRPGILAEMFPARAAREDLRQRLGLAPGELLVAVPGRIDQHSRHHDLLPLLERLESNYPSTRVLLLGDGPARPRLLDAIQRAGVAGRVVHLGARADLPEILSACDVGVIPQSGEPLPMGAVECLAAGLPLVTPWSEEACEVIEDGTNGFLSLPTNPDALCWSVEKILLMSDTERHRFGEHSRDVATEQFDLHDNLDRLMHVYREQTSVRPSEPDLDWAVPDTLPDDWLDDVDEPTRPSEDLEPPWNESDRSSPPSAG
ncbi:MAG: glycosyltransferase family 4 protein [Planctomycetota bacterium]